MVCKFGLHRLCHGIIGPHFAAAGCAVCVTHGFFMTLVPALVPLSVLPTALFISSKLPPCADPARTDDRRSGFFMVFTGLGLVAGAAPPVYEVVASAAGAGAAVLSPPGSTLDLLAGFFITLAPPIDSPAAVAPGFTIFFIGFGDFGGSAIVLDHGFETASKAVGGQIEQIYLPDRAGLQPGNVGQSRVTDGRRLTLAACHLVNLPPYKHASCFMGGC